MKSNPKPDFDKEIRFLINYETDVVNQRMNWLILLHGLLCAAFYQIYNHDIYLACLVPIVGISISLVMKHSFWMNEKAIAFILSKWNQYIEKNNLSYDDFPPVWAGAFSKWGKYSGRDLFIKNRLNFLLAHKAIPNIFLGIWIINLFYSMLILVNSFVGK